MLSSSSLSSTCPLFARPAEQEEADVVLFKEYLRFNTMHPKPDLRSCCDWLKKIAAELDMQYQEVECHPGLPNAILTLEGTDPDLPSLLLNCHSDVVPVVPSMWTALPPGQTPFSAWEDPKNGFIYARGAQDMKCVGAQYLCALRALKQQQKQNQNQNIHTNSNNNNKSTKLFKRTVHLLFVPDEEIGGANGMAKLVHTPEFKKLNVGLALDEGLAHDENRFVIFYGERTALWVSFIARGQMGHGAKLIEDTANDRLARVVERMTRKRDASVAKLKREGADLGDVTSVNWTCAQSGVTLDGGKTYAYNVIPREGRVTFDVRVALPEYHELVAEWKQWADELDLEIRYEAGNPASGPSPYSPTSSNWFNVLKTTLKEFVPDADLALRCFPAATDSRYLRRSGIPAYGFSPMRNIPSLLHDHNEYLPRSTYLEGVAVYSRIIPALANVGGDLHGAKL